MDSEAVYEVTHATIVLPTSILLFVVLLVYVQRSQPDLSHIPTVGLSNTFLSYVWAIKFIFRARSMLQEGYAQHTSSIFRVPTLTKWISIVSTQQTIEELRKMPDDELSYSEAVTETAQLYPMYGAVSSNDYYAVAALTTQLTRNLPLLFADMRKAMVVAFRDVVFTEDTTDWTEVRPLDAATEIAGRMGNHVLFGPTLCSSPEFVKHNWRMLEGWRDGTNVLGKVPTILRPLFANLFFKRNVNSMYRHLLPIIQDRLQKISTQKHDYLLKPDLLSWIAADSPHVTSAPSASSIVHRILALHQAITSKTPATFAHALHHLACAHPDVVEPMRTEVASAVRQEGWTPAALERMRRVDAFLKETLRMHPPRALTMLRKARAAYTFADGTHVPAGALVGTACWAADGERFEAGRFGGRAGPGEQLGATAPDFLAWGYGRAACPGRFFAAAQMKLMLAHVVLNYDVRTSDDGKSDTGEYCIGVERFPDAMPVMFRKRR